MQKFGSDLLARQTCTRQTRLETLVAECKVISHYIRSHRQRSQELSSKSDRAATVLDRADLRRGIAAEQVDETPLDPRYERGRLDVMFTIAPHQRQQLI